MVEESPGGVGIQSGIFRFSTYLIEICLEIHSFGLDFLIF